MAPPGGSPVRHAALEWAASGAMALTGPADGAPVLAPAPIASAARGAVETLSRLAGAQWRGGELDGAALLGERAAILGLTRRGDVSPGGGCRLLRAADGWLAVNLARPDDRALLAAWLAEGETLGAPPDPEGTQAHAGHGTGAAAARSRGSGMGRDDDDGGPAHAALAPGARPALAAAAYPWTWMARRIARRPVAALVARARLLALPVAPAAAPSSPPPPWYRVVARGTPRRSGAPAAPLVLDLSALWAGPLAAHLLALAGARVVKVESTGRPDGARRGPQAFYDLLNAGKESVALDLGTAEGRRLLAGLIARADVVVESARPRALRQLGIDAEEMVARVPGLTWVSITGYGRQEPEGDWVAFGDDAAAASGLAVATGRVAGANGPLFCADAVADPLTGLHAAVAAWATWERGGGALVALALCDVTAHVLGLGSAGAAAAIVRRVPAGGPAARAGGWEVVVGRERQAVCAPRARAPRGRARGLGADTRAVLQELAAVRSVV